MHESPTRWKRERGHEMKMGSKNHICSSWLGTELEILMGNKKKMLIGALGYIFFLPKLLLLFFSFLKLSTMANA
jgi:hypothetical protein